MGMNPHLNDVDQRVPYESPFYLDVGFSNFDWLDGDLAGSFVLSLTALSSNIVKAPSLVGTHAAAAISGHGYCPPPPPSGGC